jgi:urease accessory protein
MAGSPIAHGAPGAQRHSGWRGHLRLHYRLQHGLQDRLQDGLQDGLECGPHGRSRDGSPGGAQLSSVGGVTGPRTVAHDLHSGPLRVLQPLYPEGPAICHHVLVHPPGGVVAGDELLVDVQVDAGCHALITTPGATRFYRSDGPVAVQRASLHVANGARLEWLPLESIAHAGCRAENQVQLHLQNSAQVMGWDVLALGLPAAQQPFAADAAGWFCQHLQMPGVWLERGRVAASDHRLLTSPLGWAGHSVLGTLWLAQGSAWLPAQRQALLDAARDVLASHALSVSAGVTSPQTTVLLLRVLAPQVEPVMQLLAQVRAAWRQALWGLAAAPPRIWRT